MSVTDKVAVIIAGGFTYVNLAIAENLLLCGAQHVIVFDTTFEDSRVFHQLLKLKDKYQEKIEIIEFDVVKFEFFKVSYQEVIKQKSCVDIFIYNAGLTYTSKDYYTKSKYNFNAFVKCALFALKHMSIENGGKGGVIVNICSILGLAISQKDPVYCAAKHSVVAFVRAMMINKKHGVRFLCLCPHATFINKKESDYQIITDEYQGCALHDHHDDLKKGESHQSVTQEVDKVASAVLDAINGKEDGDVFIIHKGQLLPVTDEKPMDIKKMIYQDIEK